MLKLESTVWPFTDTGPIQGFSNRSSLFFESLRKGSCIYLIYIYIYI